MFNCDDKLPGSGVVVGGGGGAVVVGGGGGAVVVGGGGGAVVAGGVGGGFGSHSSTCFTSLSHIVPTHLPTRLRYPVPWILLHGLHGPQVVSHSSRFLHKYVFEMVRPCIVFTFVQTPI